MNIVVQNGAAGIVSCFVFGLVIAFVAWAFSRALLQAKAKARFVLWLSALGAIVSIPVLQSALHANAGSGRVETHSLMTVPGMWAAYLVEAWALLAAFGLLRVVFGAIQVSRLRTSATAIAFSALPEPARETAFRVSKRRKFDIRVSDNIHVPMAVGFFRPAVLFPKYLLDELLPEQLNQVLLHETAHLLRYDDWTNILQKVARSLLFFHPAVWWLESKLTLEREMACDEAVVEQTCDARSYAECLATLAEKTLLRRSFAMMQAAVSRVRHTTIRVKRLLVPEKIRPLRPWQLIASVIGVVTCSAALMQAPDLVSFSNTVPVRNDIASAQSEEATVRESAPKPILASLSEKKIESKSVFGSKRVQDAQAGKRRFAISHHGPSIPSRYEHAGVVLASHRARGRSIPVVITTTWIVERSVGTSDEVWVVRTWRTAVYQQLPAKPATEKPTKI